MISLFKLVRAAADTRDPARCAETVRAYREHSVAVAPTLVMGPYASATVGDATRMALLPEAIRARWQGMAGMGDPLAPILGPVYPKKVENVRLLHVAGVVVLAGTDIGNPFLVPGISLHDELALLVDDAVAARSQDGA